MKENYQRSLLKIDITLCISQLDNMSELSASNIDPLMTMVLPNVSTAIKRMYTVKNEMDLEKEYHILAERRQTLLAVLTSKGVRPKETERLCEDVRQTLKSALMKISTEVSVS